MQTNLFYVCSKPTLVHTSQILNSCFPVKKKQKQNYNRGNCPLGLWELSLPIIPEKLYHVALTRKFLGVLQKMLNN